MSEKGEGQEEQGKAGWRKRRRRKSKGKEKEEKQFAS